MRFHVAPEIYGATDGETSVLLPQAEFAVRYGVTDDIDIGGKVYLAGVQLGMKWQYLRGDFDAAIAPAVSGFAVSADDDTIAVFYLHLPFLFGANLSDRFTIAFGPKLLGAFATASIDGTGDGIATAAGLYGGLYLGLPIRVGTAFWIAPEFNAFSNLYAGDSSFDALIYQGGIGFYFGGAPEDQAPNGAIPTPPPGY